MSDFHFSYVNFVIFPSVFIETDLVGGWINFKEHVISSFDQIL